MKYLPKRSLTVTGLLVSLVAVAACATMEKDYEEPTVSLTAGVQLLSGIRLITRLMQANTGTLNYEFNAKLDLAGIYPSIRVSEGGEFNFGASPR